MRTVAALLALSAFGCSSPVTSGPVPTDTAGADLNGIEAICMAGGGAYQCYAVAPGEALTYFDPDGAPLGTCRRTADGGMAPPLGVDCALGSTCSITYDSPDGGADGGAVHDVFTGPCIAR